MSHLSSLQRRCLNGSRVLLALVMVLSILSLPTGRPVSSVQAESQAAPTVNTPHAYAPDVVLVGLKPGVSIDSVMRSPKTPNATASLTTASPVFPFAQTAQTRNPPSAFNTQQFGPLARIFKLHLKPGADVATVVKALSADPNVEYAEPDYVAQRIVVPDDPQYGSQWGLTQIGAPGAWDVSTGSITTTIAIVDSGLDTTHEDLTGKLWVNPGEIPGNGVDDDGNGLIDDVNGWNIIANNNDLIDENGHGTEVAGVAAAASNNSKGIAGVCWACRVMVVKVMQSSGIVNYSDVAAGVAYAAGAGAHVINLSLGGYADSTTLRTAIESAAQTAVVVAGAGNDNKSASFYPAAYPSVIAVAATDSSNVKASFSNFGSWVDMAAPGVNVLTTLAGGSSYGNSNGTSLSAPFVAGVAGLIHSRHLDWSATLVRDHILNTTTSIDGMNPTYVGQLGHGLLNANAALNTAAQPQMTVSGWTLDGQANARPDKNKTYQLAVTLLNTWLPARSVVGTLSTSSAGVTIPDNSGTFGDLNTGQSKTNSTDTFSVTFSNSLSYGQLITFTLNLNGADGYSLSVPFTLQVRSGVVTWPGNATIITNTTWYADQMYVITTTVKVNPGITLTIQPGTVVRSNMSGTLRIDGTLIAQGTAEQPIVFAPYPTSGTQAGTLNFVATSVSSVWDADGQYVSGSVLQHIDMTGWNIGLNDRALYIVDSAFTGGTVMGGATSPINIVAGASHIERNTFTSSASVTMNEGSPIVRGNTFSNGDSSTALMLINGCEARVESNTIMGYGTAIYGMGALTIISNTLTNNGTGINLPTWIGASPTIQSNYIVGNHGGAIYIAGSYGATIEHNLIANNGGINGAAADLGLCTANPVMVRYNTIFNNQAYGLNMRCGPLDQIVFIGNNLVGNATYDVYLPNYTQNMTLTATSNYWGIDATSIPSRIHDCEFDDPNGCAQAGSVLGKVVYDPPLNAPAPEAPGYINAVTIAPTNGAPGDPIGIGRATVDVTFTRGMITTTLPTVSFHDVRRGTPQTVDANFTPNSMGQDMLGRMWFGTLGGNGGVRMFDGANWVTYTTSNSGLGNNYVTAILGASNGDVWFAHANPMFDQAQLSRLQGTTWITYTGTLIGSGGAGGLVIGEDAIGKMWFGSANGALSFDDSTWRHYTTADGLADNNVAGIARDGQGRMWFRAGYGGIGMPDGLSVFDGVNWQTYGVADGLPLAMYMGVPFSDSRGRIWVGTTYLYGASYPVAMFDGTKWTFYGSAETNGRLTCAVSGIAEDPAGTIWMNACGSMVTFDGTQWAMRSDLSSVGTPMLFDVRGNLWFSNSGLRVLWGGADYSVVDNAQWLSSTHFRATYDVTPIIPKGTYIINASDAIAGDGMLVAPHTTQTFLVDYAGFVTDGTPPTKPIVTAQGDGTLTTLSFSWSSSDAESGIDQYRYAIGTTSGGRDVVDWTYVGRNTTSVTRNGLLLVAGQTYYVTVAARNAQGLWSQNGVSNPVVAGATPDNTPPSTPTVTASGNGTLTTLIFSWTSSGDPESSIVQYRYAIGTTVGGQELIAWTSVPSTTTNITRNSLTLVNGQTYYVTVQAQNGAGLWSANGVSNGVVASTATDNTPPTAPIVTAYGDGSLTTLSFSWTPSTDPETGVQHYHYAIGTTDGGQQVVTWTIASVITTTSITRDDLTLISGQTYYVTMQAQNGAGLWSANGVSNGVIAGTNTSNHYLYLPLIKK